MSVCAQTSGITTPHRPSCGPSNASYDLSPVSSPPLSPRATSTISETDTESSFPWTPDSKCSGIAHYNALGMSSGAQPSRTKQSNGNHNHIYHPYRQPPCFQEIHTFSGQIGRPDHDNLLGAPDSKMDDVFFRHMDGLSPASCRHVVHYKEAVRERQRMRLFTTYWELEETTRLHALLNSLYAEADLEFRKADREAQFFLKALVTKQSLSRVTSDLDFLTTIISSQDSRFATATIHQILLQAAQLSLALMASISELV